MALLLLFFMVFAVPAAVLQDDVAVTGKLPFSFKRVCERMVAHESPLIDAVSGTELDCMGKKVTASDFCAAELAQDPYYLRAYVDKEKRSVTCVSGKKVLFKYQCVKLGDRPLCRSDARAGCEAMRTKLARRLDLVHASTTSNDKGVRQLNCYFEALPLGERRHEI